MLGKSVYLSIKKEVISKTIASLKCGDICFISLHTPEDFIEDFKDKAYNIISIIRAQGVIVVADISPKGLAALGFSNLIEAAKSGIVDAFRVDYGFTTEEIIRAGKYCDIVFNASIIDDKLIKNYTYQDRKIAAMHNFYPRPETGMDIDRIIESNKFLHKNNIETWAFISGDDVLRGPIFEGLPTIEDYRYLPPYVQYVLMKQKLEVDIVFVGDATLTCFSEKLINDHEESGILQLPVNIIPDYSKILCNKVLTIRHDSNNRVARIKESREYASMGSIIEPDDFASIRKTGSITIDNAKYKRYSGEIQITKQDLKADERVNVIGNILPEYLELLELCEGNTKIILRQC